jgi:hypothetical protein
VPQDPRIVAHEGERFDIAWALAAPNGMVVLSAALGDVEAAFATDGGYGFASAAAGDVWLYGPDVPLLRVSGELN